MPTKIPEVTGFIIYGLLLKLHDLKKKMILFWEISWIMEFIEIKFCFQLYSIDIYSFAYA